MFYRCPSSPPRVFSFGDPVLWIVYRLWFQDPLYIRPSSPLRMITMADAICWVGPGLNLALTSVWLTCTLSLAVFDIEKYVDAFGNVVEPKIHYSDGIIR